MSATTATIAGVGYTVINTREKFKQEMIQLKARVEELTRLYRKVGEKAGESKASTDKSVDKSFIMIDVAVPTANPGEFGVAKQPMKVSEINTIRKALLRYILGLRYRFTVGKTTRVNTQGHRVGRPAQPQFGVLKPGFFDWMNPAYFEISADGVNRPELKDALSAVNYHEGDAATGGSKIISRKVVNQLFHAFKAIHATSARGVPLITEVSKRPVTPQFPTKKVKQGDVMADVYVTRPYRAITDSIRQAWGSALIPDVTYTRYVSEEDARRYGSPSMVPAESWKAGISQRDPMKIISRMTFKKQNAKKPVPAADAIPEATQKMIDDYKTINKEALKQQEAQLSEAISHYTTTYGLASAKKAKKKKSIM